VTMGRAVMLDRCGMPGYVPDLTINQGDTVATEQSQAVKAMLAFCSDPKTKPEWAAAAAIKVVEEGERDPFVFMSAEVWLAFEKAMESIDMDTSEMDGVIVGELILDAILTNPASLAGPLTAFTYAKMAEDGLSLDSLQAFRQAVFARFDTVTAE